MYGVIIIMIFLKRSIIVLGVIDVEFTLSSNTLKKFVLFFVEDMLNYHKIYEYATLNSI